MSPLNHSKNQTAIVLRLVWLGAAGAAGALSRYGIGMAFGTRSFPWATLGINILGSFFLGAFTTFSTFSYETQLLLRTGRPVTAAVYVTASIAGGVIAAFGGYGIARLLS